MNNYHGLVEWNGWEPNTIKKPCFKVLIRRMCVSWEPLRINCAQFDMSLIKLHVEPKCWKCHSIVAHETLVFNLPQFISKFIFDIIAATVFTSPELLSVYDHIAFRFVTLCIYALAPLKWLFKFICSRAESLMKESPVARDFNRDGSFIKLEMWIKKCFVVRDCEA